MPIETSITNNGKVLTISVVGRFSFEVQDAFRASYESANMEKYIIDLEHTEYMDSSALGMLLMMREIVGGDDADITLLNCGQDIRVILKVANFEELFTID
ncbi:STAS domain-containing protein [Kaarinaea lacus]